MTTSNSKTDTSQEGHTAAQKSIEPTLFRDLIMLAKPRIITLLVITCLAAMFVATRGNLDLISTALVFWTCAGLALSAAGANMVNMWYDGDIDALMTRTRKRPVPQGRMAGKTVLLLGIVLGVVAFALLWLSVNLLTALMAAAGYLFYVFIYTMLLKRRTVQNIVIGGAAGAFPPLVGWAAVQNSVSEPTAWLLFAVIFFWTPPHFWALALYKCADYTKAGVPMLPVVRGERETKLQILYYLLILIPITLGLGLFEPAFGGIYLITACVLGAVWFYKAIKLWQEEGAARAPDVFKFSLYYLAVLFLAMAVDTFFLL